MTTVPNRTYNCIRCCSPTERPTRWLRVTFLSNSSMVSYLSCLPSILSRPSGQLPTPILPSTEYWQQEQPTWTNWTKQDSRPRSIKDKPKETEPNGYKLKLNLISSEWKIMYCSTLRVQTYTQGNYATSGLDPTEFNTYYQTILYS